MSSISVTVRLFAAAAQAAGKERLELQMQEQTFTIADVMDLAGRDNAELARVLGQCSFLVCGKVRPITYLLPEDGLADHVQIDALPPFAGG